MVLHTALDDLSGYSAFDIHNTVYKTVDAHDIHVDVLVPKTFTPPPTGAPILLRFHGGGLITGSSLNPLMFPTYLLELATKHSAIIVVPNYRFFPEVMAGDILADTEDFWQWLHSSLPSSLAKQTNDAVKPDLTRIMVLGDSAGGYLGLQTALSHANDIRALSITYPMGDVKSSWFTEPGHKQLFDFPQVGADALENHIALVAKQAEASGGQHRIVRSEDLKLECVMLMAAFVQHGWFGKYFDLGDAAQFPLERLARGERLPSGPVLVMHGMSDSVVPIEHSRNLAQVVKKHDPNTKLTLVEKPGDHGFDNEVSLNEPWLAEALAPLVRAWLE